MVLEASKIPSASCIAQVRLPPLPEPLFDMLGTCGAFLVEEPDKISVCLLFWPSSCLGAL